MVTDAFLILTIELLAELLSIVLPKISLIQTMSVILGVIQEGLYDAKLLHHERSVLRP
jgi:hypothetical protein